MGIRYENDYYCINYNFHIIYWLQPIKQTLNKCYTNLGTQILELEIIHGLLVDKMISTVLNSQLLIQQVVQ